MRPSFVLWSKNGGGCKEATCQGYRRRRKLWWTWPWLSGETLTYSAAKWTFCISAYMVKLLLKVLYMGILYRGSFSQSLSVTNTDTWSGKDHNRWHKLIYTQRSIFINWPQAQDAIKSSKVWYLSTWKPSLIGQNWTPIKWIIYFVPPHCVCDKSHARQLLLQFHSPKSFRCWWRKAAGNGTNGAQSVAFTKSAWHKLYLCCWICQTASYQLNFS